MEQFFDLDKLHRQQRRKTIRNGLIGSLVFLLFIGVGVSALTGQKKPATHSATVSGNFSASTSSGSTSSTNQSDSPAVATPNTKPSMPKPSEPSYAAPTYTPYTDSTGTSYTPSTSTTNLATPNPALCPGIKSQEQSATASLVAQNQQLEVQLANENNAGETAQAQATTNQIIANSNQISSIEAPYITQLTENECSP